MFTDEEVKAAKQTRDEIIKENIPELKAIYMAGEIVMWNEMQSAPAAALPVQQDSGTWIDEPLEPGVYYYTLQGSKVVRVQKVLKSEIIFYGVGLGELYVVQNADGAVAVKGMKRKWCKITLPPPTATDNKQIK